MTKPAPRLHLHAAADPALRLTKISGPDRIDLQVEVATPNHDEIGSVEPAESSASIRARVEAARQIQPERFAKPMRSGDRCFGQYSTVSIAISQVPSGGLRRGVIVVSMSHRTSVQHLTRSSRR